MRHSTITRLWRRRLSWLLVALLALFTAGTAANAFHGGPHLGTYRTWAIGANPTIAAVDPYETVEDVTGLTAQVATPAAPLSMVTAMNDIGGFRGLLYWNPVTSAFKGYRLTSQQFTSQVAVDINRGIPAAAPGSFGGGDVWGAVSGGVGFGAYVNFRGSNNFRRWAIGVSLPGIRVNPSTGRVYVANDLNPSFDPDGVLVELDPVTNTQRNWLAQGASPCKLTIAGGLVYATSWQPSRHQIIRLNPVTNEIRRWNVPGGGFAPCQGAANSITSDGEGNVWFTESASDEIGRLNPITNVISEYTKPGVDNPQGIASSGAGPTLQSFFTEASPSAPGGGKVSVLTNAAASPTETTVVPTTETIAPFGPFVRTPVDFTVTPVTATIAPATTPSTSTNGSGIDRFPIPSFTSEPTGITPVVLANTVFGSMTGSDHVFQFTSTGGIVAPPPGAPCPDNEDEDDDGLTDRNENLLLTLLRVADSDEDGIVDGNDDANGNAEDDEDEDDGDDCPDRDGDGDGDDDEDEDDEDEDD